MSKKVFLSVELPDGCEDYTIKSVSILKMTNEIDYRRLPIKIVDIPDRKTIDRFGQIESYDQPAWYWGVNWLADKLGIYISPNDDLERIIETNND